MSDYLIALVIVLVIIIFYLLFANKQSTPIVEKYVPNTDQPIVCIAMKSLNNPIAGINKRYAKLKGYEFETTGKDRNESILELLDTNLYDYIFWMTENAMVNNFDKTIDYIITLDPSKDIYMSGNRDDVLLVKNTKSARRSLKNGLKSQPNYLVTKPSEFNTENGVYGRDDFIYNYSSKSQTEIALLVEKWGEDHKHLFPVID